mgnify:CR=1 FL=1
MPRYSGPKKPQVKAPKKKGKYQPCGRKSAKSSKRGYPKCVPLATAKKMTKAQMRKLAEQAQKKVEKIYLFYLVNNNPRHKDAAEIIRKLGIITNNLK